AGPSGEVTGLLQSAAPQAVQRVPTDVGYSAPALPYVSPARALATSSRIPAPSGLTFATQSPVVARLAVLDPPPAARLETGSVVAGSVVAGSVDSGPVESGPVGS